MSKLFKSAATIAAVLSIGAGCGGQTAGNTVTLGLTDFSVDPSQADPAPTTANEATQVGESWVFPASDLAAGLKSTEFNVSEDTSWSLGFNYSIDDGGTGTGSHGALTFSLYSSTGESSSFLGYALFNAIEALNSNQVIGFAGSSDETLQFGYDFKIDAITTDVPGDYWVWIDYTPGESAAMEIFHSSTNIKPAAATATVSFDSMISLPELPESPDAEALEGKTYLVLSYANADDVTELTINSGLSFTATPAVPSAP